MSAISEEIFNEAKSRLRRIETDHGVRILYAGEFGSRARGIESRDADYDVRFLFVRPVAEYLKLSAPPAMITQKEGPWDIRGLCLREALMRLKAGDPATVSWLYTDPVYRNHPLFETEMRKRLEMLAPLTKIWWHYRRRAESLNEELGTNETVTLKTLTSIVEASLSLLWVEQCKSLPPMGFTELASTLVTGDAKRNQIIELAEKKKASDEAAEARRADYPVVDECLALALAATPPEGDLAAQVDEDDLNEFFLKWVGYHKPLG